MLTLEEAQQTILGNAHSFGNETVLLDESTGRICAQPVIADRDYPPFNRAAMDGYAIQMKDLEKGIRHFLIVEVVFAGQQAVRSLGEGECFKIMTGASVPPPADIIIRKEDASENDGHVQVNIEGFTAFRYIATQGEDVHSGTPVTEEPVTCSPAVISALAAMGRNKVEVRKLPSVAVFTTGDEVVPVDAAVTPIQIRNSNLHLFRALLKNWQIRPFVSEHVADDKEKLARAFQLAMHADIIIISGGVSAGDADYVPQVLEQLGVQKLFHKVAIKPGKPICAG
jgi:molybdopterin molybdotransferase